MPEVQNRELGRRPRRRKASVPLVVTDRWYVSDGTAPVSCNRMAIRARACAPDGFL